MYTYSVLYRTKREFIIFFQNVISGPSVVLMYTQLCPMWGGAHRDIRQ